MINNAPFRNFIAGFNLVTRLWEHWFNGLWELITAHCSSGAKHLLHSGTTTLTSGTATVNTEYIADNNYVLLTTQELGTVTTPKSIGVTARTSGTSFTIESSDITDTSTVFWAIVE